MKILRGIGIFLIGILVIAAAYMLYAENANYTFDKEKAAAYVTKNAEPRSKTCCAWYVMRALQKRANRLRRQRRVDRQRFFARIELQRVLHRQHVGHVIVVQMAEHHGVQIGRMNVFQQPRQHACAAVDQQPGISAVAGQQIT